MIEVNGIKVKSREDICCWWMGFKSSTPNDDLLVVDAKVKIVI